MVKIILFTEENEFFFLVFIKNWMYRIFFKSAYLLLKLIEILEFFVVEIYLMRYFIVIPCLANLPH